MCRSVDHKEGIAGSPLIVDGQTELLDQSRHPLLPRPEPRGPQVGLPAGDVDGVDASTESISGLEHPNRSTCTNECIGHDKPADTPTDDRYIKVGDVVVGHVAVIIQ